MSATGARCAETSSSTGWRSVSPNWIGTTAARSADVVRIGPWDDDGRTCKMPNAADLYQNSMRFYIAVEWVTPEEKLFADVVNPATERVITQVALGGAAD